MSPEPLFLMSPHLPGVLPPEKRTSKSPLEDSGECGDLRKSSQVFSRYNILLTSVSAGSKTALYTLGKPHKYVSKRLRLYVKMQG